MASTTASASGGGPRAGFSLSPFSPTSSATKTPARVSAARRAAAHARYSASSRSSSSAVGSNASFDASSTDSVARFVFWPS